MCTKASYVSLPEFTGYRLNLPSKTVKNTRPPKGHEGLALVHGSMLLSREGVAIKG